jgi:hypothetical protein
MSGNKNSGRPLGVKNSVQSKIIKQTMGKMKTETFEKKVDRVFQICKRNSKLEKLLWKYIKLMGYEELMPTEQKELETIIEKIKANEEFNKY